MAARKELADALLQCLREVSSLLEQALTVAHAQQDALTQSDAEAITITCLSQEDVMRKIAQADERAAAVAATIAVENGLDPETAGTQAIAQAVGAPYDTLIAHELARVSDISQKVRDANEINSRLLRNGLEVITSCLRIVVREPEPMVYSKNASFGGSSGGVLALDSRV